MEVNPKDRCNFTYLYEYFGITKCIDTEASIENMSQLQKRMSILCDPTILKVANIRRLYFSRLNHEYKIC